MSEIEPFVVRHYTDEEGPIIKGNGFDGLRVGDTRDEAEAFVRWVNEHIDTAEQVRQLIAAERERADIYRRERDAAREQKENYLQLLVGIHNLLPPGPVEANGKTYIFNDPNANETLRELRRRIVALEDDAAIRRG